MVKIQKMVGNLMPRCLCGNLCTVLKAAVERPDNQVFFTITITIKTITTIITIIIIKHLVNSDYACVLSRGAAAVGGRQC